MHTHTNVHIRVPYNRTGQHSVNTVKYGSYYELDTAYSCDISAKITGSLLADTMLTVLVGSSSVECLSHWPSTPMSRSSFTEYWKLRRAACTMNKNIRFIALSYAESFTGKYDGIFLLHDALFSHPHLPVLMFVWSIKNHGHRRIAAPLMSKTSFSVHKEQSLTGTNPLLWE